MLAHMCQFSVIRMACALIISRSGYYAWVRSSRHPSERALARLDRDAEVKAAFDKGIERDGSRRIQVELNQR